MTDVAAVRAGAREWLVLAVVSTLMIFAQATVFAALGIALFAMSAGFGWTAAQAGAGFTLVVLGACIAAPLAAILTRRTGARWTLALGALVLASAFALAAKTDSLATIYAATTLAGTGFSLSANTPGIYIIAGWAGPRAPRMIGIYLMLGMVGNAIGPLAAQWLCAGNAGWRGYWQAMALVATVLAIACATLLREPPPPPSAGEPRPDPHVRGILAAPTFVVMALAMVATQTCIVTVSSVTAAHFATRGWSSAYAARILGIQGLIGAIATGASGFLTGYLRPKPMLAAALLLTALGMVLLGIARTPLAAYGFALGFGAGSCIVTLAVSILLVEYFGHAGSTTGLAAIWTLAGAAAIGPWATGLAADRLGSFTPALAGLGLLLIPLAAATWRMAPPSRRAPPATYEMSRGTAASGK